ncbi:MAG: sigma-54 dependent transcriptional regulator, partial [Rhodospirillaceae bacterium]
MAHDILIVDDEADIRMLIAGILNDEGMKTREAGNSDQALAQLKARRPSLVVLDIWLQGSRLDGLELLPELRKDHPDLPIVMISGHGTIETAVAAIKLGAYDFIEKPFKSDRLLLLVERAIEATKLRRENTELRLRVGGDFELVGKSAALNGVKQAIDKVAPTGSRVMITGPAGSGKEVVARLAHKRSRRAEGPFVTLNCANLRPDRLDIELFGSDHVGESGRRKIGVLEQAHGGTLLLDEVADMPLETQGKIVRVLQEHTFVRQGGGNKVEIDVRVFATTNRDLATEIETGRFRQDLFYRLNVVPLLVPSLAERREDIPVLARHFMERSAQASGLSVREFGEDALAALQAYHWPGNVRQLRNCIDWLLIMSTGDVKELIR